MDIPGVPESVPLSRIVAFLDELGLPLGLIPKSQGGVVFTGQSIKATSCALNTEGRRYIDRASGEVATHAVHIPVMDDIAPNREDDED